MEMLIFTDFQQVVMLELFYLRQKEKQFYVYAFNEAKDGYTRYNGMTVDVELYRYKEYYMTYQDFGDFVHITNEENLHFANIKPSMNEIRLDKKVIELVRLWPEKYYTTKILNIKTVDCWGSLSENIIVEDQTIWTTDELAV